MTLQGVKHKVVTVSDFRFTGRLLGKGNFARVEEAVHNVLNMKVAVKVINIKEVKEKYVLKNLHREARIMSTLHHPCIASLFQTMQLADNVYYLVTELVAGGDLCSFIIGQRYGKLEERLARIYARQFASALSHMHSFGIVHRDLKMENVILNLTQTQIKIVDFGLSNVWTKDNPLRTHCGSPEYAAPELFIAGKEYGPEVDLWSLGIIFYGMVVGQLPFVGGRKNQVTSQEHRKKLVAQINKGLGTSQRQAIGTLTPEFRSMINKLLMADPVKRISVQELVVHPWITEKGRKFVQTHPLKKLDGQWQTKFTKQIGEVFKIDEKTTSTEILKNPNGRLGGMYNMLRYKHIIAHFNPDNIAVDVRSINIIDKKEEITVPNKIKSASASRSHHSGLYNQCAVLLNKVYKQQQLDERAKSANPSLSQPKNPTTTTRSTRTKSDNNSKSAKATYCKTNTLTLNRKNPEQNAPISLRKTISSKLHNSSDNKPSTEEIIQMIRRPSTAGTMRTTPNRPLKRTSVPTAAAVTTATPPRPAYQKATNNREYQRHYMYKQPWEMGMGDATTLTRKESRVTTTASSTTAPKTRLQHRLLQQQQQQQQQQQHLANDPIARSIAGYLEKNVPDKMFNLQMIRK